MLFSILVRTCGAQPMIANSISNIVKGEYADNVTYECVPGYWHHANLYNINTTCGEDELWNNDIYNFTCKGNHSNSFI